MAGKRTIRTVELSAARIATLSQIVCNQLRVEDRDDCEVWDLPSVEVLAASANTLRDMAEEVEQIRSRVTSKIIERMDQMED